MIEVLGASGWSSKDYLAQEDIGGNTAIVYDEAQDPAKTEQAQYEKEGQTEPEWTTLLARIRSLRLLVLLRTLGLLVGLTSIGGFVGLG